MGQWEFGTNNESVQASIAAYNVATGTLYLELPLNRDAIKKKIEEARDFVIAYNINQCSVFKWPAVEIGTKLLGDSQKRMCTRLNL